MTNFDSDGVLVSAKRFNALSCNKKQQTFN